MFLWKWGENMTETKEFIWLTNDLVFKHIFSNKRIIKDFYNSYLKYIKSDLSILNVRVTKQKYIQNDNIKLHNYYLDIVLVLSNGELVNIEMYNNFGETECMKSLAYASYIYSHQLKKNNPYRRLKKVTSFNIMNGNYKLTNNEIINKYELINVINHKKILKESIEMLLIRLDILDDISYSKDEERFIRWCRLLYAKTREEAIKIANGDELMMSTVEMVDDFINDPEVISIFHDDSWKIVSAEQRGKAEEKIETAKNMLKEKCSPKFISKITNLSISEINKLKVN